MTYIVNSLAAYEVHVARFYYSKGAYVAAVNRAQLAITDYPGVPAAKEALEILAKSYGALGMEELRADALRVLETNFPKTLTTPNSKPTAWWKFW
jgi:outer membrane protein assembly factor BamD